MSIKDILFCSALAILSLLWWGDRSKQFEKGKASCVAEYVAARDVYIKQLEEENNKKLKEALDRAANAEKENAANEKTKTVFIEKIRTINVPTECTIPDSFVQEFNKARDSLRKK